jgi:hypothetical protein
MSYCVALVGKGAAEIHLQPKMPSEAPPAGYRDWSTSTGRHLMQQATHLVKSDIERHHRKSHSLTVQNSVVAPGGISICVTIWRPRNADAH